MMVEGPKRKQHTVPKFYLRNFAQNESLTTVSLPGTKKITQHIKRSSVIRSYYSLNPQDFPAGEVKEDDFENWLSNEFEGPGGGVFRKILEEGIWPLTIEDRAILAKFITLQMMRVPAYRELMTNTSTFTIYATLAANGRENLRELAKKYFGKDYTEESLDIIWEEIKEGTFTVKPDGNRAHIASIMNDLERNAYFVLGRPWILVRFSRKTLITSDNPVVVVPAPDGEPTGIGNAPEILFPLSRDAALIMGHPYELGIEEYEVDDIYDGKYDFRCPPNAILHMQLMKNLIHAAQKYLYCHPEDVEKLPEPLPNPKEPRNFKHESQQFIQIGEALRKHKNTT